MSNGNYTRKEDSMTINVIVVIFKADHGIQVFPEDGCFTVTNIQCCMLPDVLNSAMRCLCCDEVVERNFWV